MDDVTDLLPRFVAAWLDSPFGAVERSPWGVTNDLPALVAALLPSLCDDYVRTGDAAVHRSATVEPGAALKGPLIVGPDCFIAATALLRGGVWLGAGCIIGPACELKSSLMFAGAKLAHLNFVGDSILGAGVNVEAGAMIANYRNEREDKRIRIRTAHGVIETGVEKFGALVGDHVRIGANAVIAPGALLAPRTVVPRLHLVDQAFHP
ncbi:LbetaH domain-containing protein [Sandaracinobacteroides saxicola]|uniref:Transferase n=1 Tax=Sandaracinobacteroides saxicola TaxID=2759707 RepID=A0A7G5IF94_9SPHN|nr:transferase [Sandaracinobacteroides saxicola]QMW22036.1 transferase [Sandaracinobacteroides saxicola]